ncbi:NADPH:quinone oxidoreductase family protein [Vannielia litorea]|uniref:NADPH:quinone oxidoreductase family protein n=1 Tax=Vannielia litorea TaxID=1217970 RepID=UPI001C94691B|nr:NADPH:quinone oxidoreductase family protein [Vannielia litorea]MBY6047968.1 NADPH:quinone oxidoreductase family protein [Vannielia litorea]MBY6075382.1 NADPH:quinone oxidoreductase family protein [Vannielia litorea]
MKAYRVTATGERPALTDVPSPEPAPGEVAVQIAACGLNFADLLMVEGTYQDTPPAPFTLGIELAGAVTALGQGVEELAVGDRIGVFGGRGGLAEEGCFPASRCLKLPETMPFHIAAAFLVAYGTSHLSLVHRARLAKGERLVVTGAAGGVGLTAVELGAKLGAEVVAIARGADKLEVAAKAGATHLIDAQSEDIRGQLKALGGLDVLYDTVGDPLFTECFRAARPEARLLAIGFAGGKVPQIKANHLLVKNLTVMGLYWGGYMGFAPEVLTGSLGELMKLWETGGLDPHVSHRLPLDQIDEAMDLIRTRRSTGKVVVEPQR